MFLQFPRHAVTTVTKFVLSRTASTLYCEKCKATNPVRERLLLVLPEKEIFDYLCTECGSSVGSREVTAGDKAVTQAMQPRRPKRRIPLKPQVR